MKKILLLSLSFLLSLALNAQNCSCGSGNLGAFASNALNDNAGFLNKKAWLFDLNYDYRSFTPFTSKEITKMLEHNSDAIGVSNAWIATLKVSYGVSDKLALSVMQPYVNIATTINQKMDGDRYNILNSASTNAFADFSVFGTYLFYNKNNLRLAAIAGIELPTGKVSTNQNAIITGSGTFDPILGISGSKKMGRFITKANVGYKLTTKNSSGMDYGDFLSHQVGLNYTINKNSSSDSACTSLSKKIVLMAGLNLIGENLHPIKNNNVEVKNTGYYRNFVSPAFTVVLKDRLVSYLAMDIPVLQNNYGVQNASSYRFRVGLSVKIN